MNQSKIRKEDANLEGRHEASAMDGKGLETAKKSGGEGSILDRHITRRSILRGGTFAAVVAAAGVIGGRELLDRAPGDRVSTSRPLTRAPLLSSLHGTAGHVGAGPLSPLQSTQQTSSTVNQVVQWNKILLTIVRTPGAQPATIHSSRSFAIMHAAIYDAVNAIEGTYMPYLVQPGAVSGYASADVAAAAAAHEVLVNLYPSFQMTLDAQLQQSLAQIQGGVGQSVGVALGQSVADSILAIRSNDGSQITLPPYVYGTGAGDFQSTPPNFPKQPQYHQWAQVTPFTLEAANQFRPGPPPSLTSQAYTFAFNEIKTLGIVNSTAITPDQAQIGAFWGGQIQDYWNEIAQTAAIAHNLTTAESARLFGLLNLAIADDTIAFYDAKYTYNFWRPVTAIREAQLGNNPQTVADPNWLPSSGNTPTDPSYPGAHAVTSSAAATVLISFFNRDQFAFNATSEVLPGVVRSFQSFSAAATEASLSRIYWGDHFRTDESAGQDQGRQVAHFVVDNFMLPTDMAYESSTSTITVSTASSSGSPISGYDVTLWKDGQQLQTRFSPCSFNVDNGEYYQLSVSNYGSESFAHWSDGTTTSLHTLAVPDTSTTLQLTAIYNP